MLLSCHPPSNNAKLRNKIELIRVNYLLMISSPTKHKTLIRTLFPTFFTCPTATTTLIFFYMVGSVRILCSRHPTRMDADNTGLVARILL